MTVSPCVRKNNQLIVNRSLSLLYKNYKYNTPQQYSTVHYSTCTYTLYQYIHVCACIHVQTTLVKYNTPQQYSTVHVQYMYLHFVLVHTCMCMYTCTNYISEVQYTTTIQNSTLQYITVHVLTLCTSTYMYVHVYMYKLHQ